MSPVIGTDSSCHGSPARQSPMGCRPQLRWRHKDQGRRRTDQRVDGVRELRLQAFGNCLELGSRFSRVPFIFQLPATSGRMSGVICCPRCSHLCTGLSRRRTICKRRGSTAARQKGRSTAGRSSHRPPRHGARQLGAICGKSGECGCTCLCPLAAGACSVRAQGSRSSGPGFP
jgi:hypothetical protein